MEEVEGSNPSRSTMFSMSCAFWFACQGQNPATVFAFHRLEKLDISDKR